jgi:formylmethanofuran dehydrogenase subunit A
MTLLKIAGGTVYDPANGVDGVVQDVWVQDGKVVAPPAVDAGGAPTRRPDRVLDARGLVVMPGGVDMHAHIAGPKVNLARKMRPEDKRKAPVVRRTPLTRSGTTGSVPSTFATGYLYAGMGYTTAFDAAIPPLAARHAHEEFHDTPTTTRRSSTRASSSSSATTTTPSSRSTPTSPSGCAPSPPGCCTRPRRMR